MLDRVFSLLRINRKLLLGKNATLAVTNADNTETTVNIAELAALDGLSATELGYLDGVTAGTALASKAVVLDSSKDVTGVRVVSGTAAAQGVDATLKGGTSSTTGNAGGAAKLVGGTPGATGVGGAAHVTGAAGGATSGDGGDVVIAGGAATANNDDGGSITLTGGAKHGTGLDGGVFNRGTFQFRKMAAPATATDTASLTDAQMVAGVLVATPTAAAAYTVRTGTQLKAALPADLTADDSFDLTIINLGGTGDDITLTAATDITIVGDPVVGPTADVATEQSSVGTFRFRFVSGTTFVAYRVG
jgi:hypothetical protein